MSTEQPPNEPPDRGEPPHQGPDLGKYPDSGGQGQGGGPYGSPPPPPYAGDPYGTDSVNSNPYGGSAGAADPLAGMPPLANRGKRLLARIVDGLIIGIPVGIVMGLAQGFSWRNTGSTYGQELVFTLVYLVYEGMMLTRSGQTVGKRLMKIRVAMLADGAIPAGSPGWLRAAVYQIPPLIPCIGTLFWLVNVLFCTWDRPYRQCVHDKAARTVVVAVEEHPHGAG